MTTAEPRSGGLGLFCLGLVLGAAVAGVGVFLIKQREIARRQAHFDSILAAKSDSSDAADNSAKELAERIRKLGDEVVEDLRSDRLLSVYRRTTPAYQRQTTREAFDAMVRQVPKLRNLSTDPAQRKSKVRKTPDANKWEYDCSAKLLDAAGVAHVSLTFVELEGDWRIDAIEFRQEG